MEGDAIVAADRYADAERDQLLRLCIESIRLQLITSGNSSRPMFPMVCLPQGRGVFGEFLRLRLDAGEAAKVVQQLPVPPPA